ncbi:hypothetical protein [Paludibacterium paludis]|uniref:MFS transporter n=1 Tax=Paludibacterium paludis TaxID=1225769 RepID=A0A918NX22_9NEIS|nr:hypothetical protein [Paludibacterium paludis]GGY02743.1 hypothetical protein GCM10011289_01100 [Paludibacterium paludis]
MFALLLKVLGTRRWLRYLVGALFLTSIGNGLTFVVVFGELLRLQVPPSSLALTFVLASAPGYLGSLAGERLLRRYSPFSLLAAGEISGCAGLVLPLAGALTGSVPWLMMSECVAAFCTGLTLPALSQVFKRGLSASELPAATTLETLAFASYVLFGVGVGAALSGAVPPVGMLAADAASFCLALGMLRQASVWFRGAARAPSPAARRLSSWRLLSARERRAVLLLPLLGVVGSPAMALLPALVATPPDGGRTAMALLFARSLGQLAGPLLLSVERFRRDDQDRFQILGSLALFVGAYMALPHAGPGGVAMGLVFLAHVFSNIVFALAIHALLSGFDEARVGAATAMAFRWQMAAGSAAALGAGWLADAVGAVMAQAVFGIGSLIFAWGVLRAVRA